MLHTSSIAAPGGHRGCELPAACQSHSQVIWHLWAGPVWETETFGRVGEDGKEAEGTLLQTKSGDTLWEDVLDDRGRAALRGWRPRTALYGTGAPWKGCSWRLSLLQHREKQGAACRSHCALALRLFTTHLTKGSGRDWTYSKSEGMLRLRRGEQRCLPEAEPG